MAMAFTYDDGYSKDHQGRIRKIVVAWTSDAGGDAAATTLKINGELLKGVTVPDSVAAPTTLYDIVLTDEDGANLLSGSFDDLADRSATVTETVEFLLTNGTAPIAAHPVVNSAITVTVSNAGNAKSGTLAIYYKA